MAMTSKGEAMLNVKGVQANKIFLDPVFQDAEITTMFRVIPNVIYRQKMLHAGEMDEILRLKTGCGFKPVGGMSIYERCIETYDITADTQQCYDEYFNTVFQEAYNKGVRITDLTGTVMQSIWLNRVLLSMKKQIIKLAFFGDKATADETQNLVDGLWTVYIPQLVTQGLVTRIDSNSGTPLAAGEGIELLDKVMDEAKPELKATGSSEKFIIVSNNVYERLEKDIRNGVAGDAAYISEVENGRNAIRFRGVSVMPMYLWQGLAAQYMTGIIPGAANGDANLVLYTTRDNLVLATDVVSSFTEVKTMYDDFEELNKMCSRFKLGFNYVHPSLMSVAY